MPRSPFPTPANKRPISVLAELRRAIRANLSSLKNTLAAIRRIRAYWAMSDAELRARSLKREDIVRLVMAGVL